MDSRRSRITPSVTFPTEFPTTVPTACAPAPPRPAPRARAAVFAHAAVIVLALAGFAAASPAGAQEAEQLARQYACLGCHSIDKHTPVAPSLQKIAERYRDRKDAVAYLADRISSGSKGAWSDSAKSMPAYPMLTPPQVRSLAQWIMAIQ